MKNNSNLGGNVAIEPRNYLIVPSDPAQREFTEAIERASRACLLADYKIRLNPMYMTTFACVYMEAIITTMVGITNRSNEADMSLNFMDLVVVSSDNRTSDDGDKDGNINVRFTPGPIANSIMERDFAPVVDPKTWQGTIINEVEKTCARILSTKHKATCDELYTWSLIAYVYFQFMIRHVKMAAKEAHDAGKKSVSFNFLEMIEIHCVIGTEENPNNPDLVSVKYDLKFRPGFQAKLLIKNDNATEIDD